MGSKQKQQKHLVFIEPLERRALLSTYYVSPTGSDANAGTSIAPFATLQRGANAIIADAVANGGIAAGDTMIARAGTYASGFVLGWDTAASGNASAPITFEADPAAPAGSVVITGREAKTPDGIDFEPGCHYVVVKGFTVNNASGTITRAGIRVTSSDHSAVLNNVTDHCGTWGIFTSHTNYILIQGNTTSNSQTQHGIYVSNACVQPIVRGNLIFGNFGSGLHMNGDLSQGGNGLILDALVEDNIIHDNGRNGGSGINCDGVQSSRFQNNLLYNNHASGISLFQINGAAGSINNVVVNNTILEAADARWCVNINSASTGNLVYNNILYNYNAAHGAINITADSLSGFVSDYNAVDGRFSPGDSGVTIPLAQWRSTTGQDQHSFIATPAQLFVNPAMSDFHLLSTAPAVDAGVPTLNGQAAPIFDLAGSPRPMGPGLDIGAYELAQAAQVIGRHVFYNNSSYDHLDASANAFDDGAIAPDKSALLPGQTATFANYTSYDKGINGLMIDVANLPTGALSASDFGFRVSTDGVIWNAAPAVSAITVRRAMGVNGSDRVEILFPDDSITNQWLQITVNANARTGLAAPDVFYFGNLVGGTGQHANLAIVNTTDIAIAKLAVNTAATLASIADFNRNGVVTITDVALAKLNNQHSIPLFTAPATPALVPPARAAVASTGNSWLGSGGIEWKSMVLLEDKIGGFDRPIGHTEAILFAEEAI